MSSLCGAVLFFSLLVLPRQVIYICIREQHCEFQIEYTFVVIDHDYNWLFALVCGVCAFLDLQDYFVYQSHDEVLLWPQFLKSYLPLTERNYKNTANIDESHFNSERHSLHNYILQGMIKITPQCIILKFPTQSVNHSINYFYSISQNCRQKIHMLAFCPNVLHVVH